jgi:hypothetical protein
VPWPAKAVLKVSLPGDAVGGTAAIFYAR